MAAPIIPDEVARIIALTHGLMEDSGRYWCYVAVKPSRYKEFQHAIQAKYNIQNFAGDGYGEIIVSGRGDMPPDAITKQVADLFGTPVASFFTDSDPEAVLAVKLASAQTSET